MRYFAYGALAFLIILAGVVFFFLKYKPAPTEITIQGSNAQMGEAYGKALRLRIRLLTSIYLHKIVCENKPALIQARQKKALETVQNWPTNYQEEVQAAAKAAGVAAADLIYANSLLDFGNVQAGCRSVVITSSNLHLHAHNLDWDSLGGLGKWTTCVVRRNPSDGRFRTVSVGFPGLIGSLDVINEKGLALSFNQLGTGKGCTNEPVWIMIRRIAETCTSLEDARKELLKAPRGMPFIITVSDAANRTGAVFERSKDTINERPVSDGWLAACNAAQDSKAGSTRLDQIVSRTKINTAAELKGVLTHEDVLMGCNIYSIIFDFRNNQLLIASGEVPAAVEPFRILKLFDN